MFAASLVNTNVGALTAARGEASGADLVIVSPNATTLSIVNVDSKLWLTEVLTDLYVVTCSCENWVCAAGTQRI